MGWFFLFVFLAALFLPQTAATQSPTRGNPKLPTVSQSRRIPLVLGKCLVEGPNVIDADSYTTTKLTRKLKGLFSSTKVDVGFKYYQSMDVGIAHGEGVLYEIRAGQYTAC
jgi:hypothetical protein